MYRFTLLCALALSSATAYAQDTTVDTTASSGSNSGASTHTTVDNTLNIQTQQLRKTEVKTAPGHGLAATTNSFSSDYCGGTVQVGGSGMGFSVGASRQEFDPNCQALRRAASFGQQSAHMQNIHQPDWAMKLAMMATWEVCRSDPQTIEACEKLGLVGNTGEGDTDDGEQN